MEFAALSTVCKERLSRTFTMRRTLEGRSHRCQDSLCSSSSPFEDVMGRIWDRPRGHTVDSKPSRCTVDWIHVESPWGEPIPLAHVDLQARASMLQRICERSKATDYSHPKPEQAGGFFQIYAARHIMSTLGGAPDFRTPMSHRRVS